MLSAVELGPRAQTPAIRGRYLRRHPTRIIYQRQQEGQVELRGLRRIVDADGESLADDCPEKRGPRQQPNATRCGHRKQLRAV
jgi:hypothetical protein